MGQTRTKQLPQVVMDLIEPLQKLREYYSKEGLKIDMEIDGLSIKMVDPEKCPHCKDGWDGGIAQGFWICRVCQCTGGMA